MLNVWDSSPNYDCLSLSCIKKYLSAYIIIGGRSPFTWYPEEYVDKVPMTDMNMRANTSRNFPGRTYRFYNGKSIYEFGHGLSYSKFSKFIQSAPSTLLIQSKSSTTSNDDSTGQAIDISTINCMNLSFELVVGVRNNGPRDGTHVVLVFLKAEKSVGLIGAPNVQLIGFERVEVKSGNLKYITLKIDVCKGFSLVDSEGKRKLVTGQHMIIVGSSSESQVKHSLDVKLAKSVSNGGLAFASQ